MIEDERIFANTDKKLSFQLKMWNGALVNIEQLKSQQKKEK